MGNDSRLPEMLAAYYTMEAAFYNELKTYSGGLGVLAGDFLKSAADLRIPISGLSLLYNLGYFDQVIENGRQVEKYTGMDPMEYMTILSGPSGKPYTVPVNIEGRDVNVGCARMYYNGVTGFLQPQYFLFTHGLNQGKPCDVEITDRLYKKTDNDNDYWRISQEAVLGIGGVKMLHLLAEKGLLKLPEKHMWNEGHAAFAGIELMKRYGLDKARAMTSFTTHTPVDAGHDKFLYDKVYGMLWKELQGVDLRQFGGLDRLNMTRLAFELSIYANTVANRNGIVIREMFKEYIRERNLREKREKGANAKVWNIDSITNGVHSKTWTSKVFKKLYDEHFNQSSCGKNWRIDPSEIENIDKVSDNDILQAHKVAKRVMLDYIKKKTGETFDEDKLTIGFARRFATYKRGGLIFSDLERLVDTTKGQVQFVLSGKAHPNDFGGKEIIRQVIEASEKLKGRVKVVFIPNYEMDKGLLLTSGCDVWLNIPVKPKEASGTSGMKAAHNGVPHFSTIDGWWDEVLKEADGERRGGWSIGNEPRVDELSNPTPDIVDLDSFHYRLKNDVMPAFKNEKEWARVMKGAIKNASYFNSHRMVKEYCKKSLGLTDKEIENYSKK